MATPRILAFSGSARKGSLNQVIAGAAAQGALQAGADVTVVSLGDYELPLFDQDLEAEGTPENAVKLKALFVEHDGFLIGCPEYNSSITPLLKNAIDWVSRPAEGEKPMVAYRGKTAALVAASPGALGGMRGLNHVRSILTNIGVYVIPSQVAVPVAHEKIADGEVTEDRTREKLVGIGRELAHFTAALT